MKFMFYISTIVALPALDRRQNPTLMPGGYTGGVPGAPPGFPPAANPGGALGFPPAANPGGSSGGITSSIASLVAGFAPILTSLAPKATEFIKGLADGKLDATDLKNAAALVTELPKILLSLIGKA